MSIQQNFPSISPSLSLNFARSKTLDPRITFTRTSSATRVNGQGLIEVIPANSARFDHSYNPVSGTVRSLGLLVEEARTNLFPNNHDPASGASGTATKTTVFITLPSGEIGAALETNASAFAENIRSITASSNTALGYLTFYAKKKTSGTGTLRITMEGGGTTRSFHARNINSETWTKISTTHDWSSSTTTGRRFDIYLPVVDSSDGDTSFYTTYYQFEEGSFPTSYIPTSGSTVTRTADNVSMVGENFSSWYNSSEGSIYCSFYRNLEPSTFHYPVGVRDQSDVNNRIHILFSTAFNGIIRGGIIKDGVTQVDSFTAAVYSRTSINKSIISYEENNVTAAASGSLGGTNTTAQIPQNINQMVVGAIGPTGQLNGHISQLTYYPKRLPNAFLQNLTK